MTVRAVGDHVRDLLNHQSIGNFQEMQAYSELPPLAQSAVHPQVFIWPGSGVEKRESMPRGMGLKQATHQFGIYVLIAMKPTDVLSFRDLIEGIMRILRTSPLPVRGITDVVTGETSDIMSIGEGMRYTYEAPKTLKTQRLMEYVGSIEAEIVEYFRA
jgi:hypothetical protein